MKQTKPKLILLACAFLLLATSSLAQTSGARSPTSSSESEVSINISRLTGRPKNPVALDKVPEFVLDKCQAVKVNVCLPGGRGDNFSIEITSGANTKSAGTSPVESSSTTGKASQPPVNANTNVKIRNIEAQTGVCTTKPDVSLVNKPGLECERPGRPDNTNDPLAEIIRNKESSGIKINVIAE